MGDNENATCLSRLERKRIKEKRRRKDFRESVASLLAALKHHDEDFRSEASTREARGAHSVGLTAKDGDNTLFNRVEIVNQASFTIDHLFSDNNNLKPAIIALQSGRKPNPPQADSSAHRSAGFHQGVGPLVAPVRSPPRADSNTTTQGPRKQHESPIA